RLAIASTTGWVFQSSFLSMTSYLSCQLERKQRMSLGSLVDIVCQPDAHRGRRLSGKIGGFLARSRVFLAAKAAN
ncbi:MAG: hypothetical protein KKH37_07020, partial [Alphaproteobacteria bacterium]|nr:hypothetical protein [Alphaproteobacteria bacterium]